MIPLTVRKDHRLSSDAILLFGDLINLSRVKGYCYATNTALAEIHGCDSRSISRYLKQLTECGYIRSELFEGNDRKIFLIRTDLSPIDGQDCQGGHDKKSKKKGQNCHTPSDKSVHINRKEKKKSKIDKLNKEQQPDKPAGDQPGLFDEPRALQMPWKDSAFLAAWDRWKKYKSKQHRFTYKSLDSEQEGLNELDKFAGGKLEIALEIIVKSIANGWKGLFALKQDHSLTPSQKAQQQYDATITTTAGNIIPAAVALSNRNTGTINLYDRIKARRDQEAAAQQAQPQRTEDIDAQIISDDDRADDSGGNRRAC